MAFLAVSETIETNSSRMLEVSLQLEKKAQKAFGLLCCAKDVFSNNFKFFVM